MQGLLLPRLGNGTPLFLLHFISQTKSKSQCRVKKQGNIANFLIRRATSQRVRRVWLHRGEYWGPGFAIRCRKFRLTQTLRQLVRVYKFQGTLVVGLDFDAIPFWRQVAANHNYSSLFAHQSPKANVLSMTHFLAASSYCLAGVCSYQMWSKIRVSKT